MKTMIQENNIFSNHMYLGLLQTLMIEGYIKKAHSFKGHNFCFDYTIISGSDNQLLAEAILHLETDSPGKLLTKWQTISIGTIGDFNEILN